MAEFPTTMAVPFNAKLQHCASFNTVQVQHCSSSTLSKLNTLCKKIHDSSVIDAPLCLSCPIIQCIYCTALDRIVTHVQHFITVYCGVSLGLMFGPTCNTMHNAQCNCSSSTLCKFNTLCTVYRRVSLGLMFGPTCNTMHNASSTLFKFNTLCTVYRRVSLGLMFGPTCLFNTNPQQSTLSNTAC